MEADKSSKLLLKQYGLLAGILIGLFAIAAAVVLLSENKWHSGLKEEIEQVLEEEEPGEWAVGDYMPIKAPVALSSACFAAKNRKTGARSLVLMLRVETLYGPFPAVFAYNEKSGARFIGIAGLHGRIRRMIGDGSHDEKIQYWMKRIPRIVSSVDENQQKREGGEKS